MGLQLLRPSCQIGLKCVQFHGFVFNFFEKLNIMEETDINFADFLQKFFFMDILIAKQTAFCFEIVFFHFSHQISKT